MGLKRIVLITTGQPSTNPRAVKEATALITAGYEVTFIYNFWTEWALPFDDQIIKENSSIHWLMAGANPVKNKVAYYLSRVRHKYVRLLSKFFPKNIFIARQTVTREFYSLVQSALKIEADMYIAHTLGALPAAAMAANKNNAKYGFDAEDYHRGQDTIASPEQVRTILLEDKYLPGAKYITAASPLIAEQYANHYDRSVTVINNVFSKKYLAKTFKNLSKPIKLFWFSQTIGKGRGLEDVILALKEMPTGAFSLTLIGKHDAAIINYFKELGNNKDQQVDMHFLLPVSPDELFEIAAQHHIGLALEQPGELNRELCLTNKIFTYVLAGNAIIFSDTKAQEQFFEENKEIGFMYKCGNRGELKNILEQYYINDALLLKQRQISLEAADTKFNWEIESGKLIKIIEAQ